MTLEHSAVWNLCKLVLPGAGLHHHAGLHLEPEKPLCTNEFFWAAELPGSFFAVGVDGILIASGKLCHR